MWDATTHATAAAIDGLARRADIRAHNIANTHTPGYRALDLPFERDLQVALQRGATPTATTTGPTFAPSIVDDRGNSVDLETELVGAMRPTPPGRDGRRLQFQDRPGARGCDWPPLIR